MMASCEHSTIDASLRSLSSVAFRSVTSERPLERLPTMCCTRFVPPVERLERTCSWQDNLKVNRNTIEGPSRIAVVCNCQAGRFGKNTCLHTSIPAARSKAMAAQRSARNRSCLGIFRTEILKRRVLSTQSPYHSSSSPSRPCDDTGDCYVQVENGLSLTVLLVRGMP